MFDFFKVNPNLAPEARADRYRDIAEQLLVLAYFMVLVTIALLLNGWLRVVPIPYVAASEHFVFSAAPSLVTFAVAQWMSRRVDSIFEGFSGFADAVAFNVAEEFCGARRVLRVLLIPLGAVVALATCLGAYVHSADGS